MALFLILLAIPLIEIALFVVIGERIGVWWTLGTVLVTALLGAYALRSQGFALMSRMSRAEAMLEAPTLLSEGVLLFAAGLLLLTPGFLTDAIGLSLLVPAVRRVVAQAILSRAKVVVATRTGGAQSPGGGPAGGGGDPSGAAHEERGAAGAAGVGAPPGAKGPAEPVSPAPGGGVPRNRPKPGRGDVEDAVEIPPRRDDPDP